MGWDTNGSLYECLLATELLPGVHDAMYSFDIKKEERDALFTVENIFIVILLSDLKPFFKDKLLRFMDKTVLLVSTVYRKADEAANDFGQVTTKKTDEFVDDIYFDDFGNLWGQLKVNGNTQHPIQQTELWSEECH